MYVQIAPLSSQSPIPYNNKSIFYMLSSACPVLLHYLRTQTTLNVTIRTSGDDSIPPVHIVLISVAKSNKYMRLEKKSMKNGNIGSKMVQKS